MNYTTKLASIPGPERYIGTLKVSVFDGDVKIGEYDRNYPSFYNTFVPFSQDGKDYALYSKDYTSTRVMELPSCKDLGGEEPYSFGFCPVDFLVPKEWGGKLGFVAGCIWGDDSSWKVEVLDLSKVSEGIIKRDQRFGYLELSHNQSLKDAIEILGSEADGEENWFRFNTSVVLKMNVPVQLILEPNQDDASKN